MFQTKKAGLGLQVDMPSRILLTFVNTEESWVPTASPSTREGDLLLPDWLTVWDTVSKQEDKENQSKNNKINKHKGEIIGNRILGNIYGQEV